MTNSMRMSGSLYFVSFVYTLRLVGEAYYPRHISLLRGIRRDRWRYVSPLALSTLTYSHSYSLFCAELGS